MELLDPYWSAYKRLQDLSLNTFTINQRAMALESALTDLLHAHDADFCRPCADEGRLDSYIAKFIDTSFCRERSRARLRASHHEDIEKCPAYEHGIIAAVALREYRELSAAIDWDLLLAVAEGMTYGEIEPSGNSQNSLRTRVSRTRSALKKAA